MQSPMRLHRHVGGLERSLLDNPSTGLAISRRSLHVRTSVILDETRLTRQPWNKEGAASPRRGRDGAGPRTQAEDSVEHYCGEQSPTTAGPVPSPLAVADATSGDSIVFSSRLGGRTIALQSEIDITNNISISGPARHPVVLSGGGKNRVLEIDGATVSLANLVVTQGSASDRWRNSRCGWQTEPEPCSLYGQRRRRQRRASCPGWSDRSAVWREPFDQSLKMHPATALLAIL